MKVKESIKNLKYSWLVLFKYAMQQTGMTWFISGIYRREWQEENCKVVEEVSIRKISNIAEMYTVKKVISKYYTPDQKSVYKHKMDEWLAAYNYATSQLQEINGHRQCSFIPEQRRLFLGKFIYMKTREIDSQKSLRS